MPTHPGPGCFPGPASGGETVSSCDPGSRAGLHYLTESHTVDDRAIHPRNFHPSTPGRTRVGRSRTPSLFPPVMIPNRSDGPPPPAAREDACPQLTGRFGSLDAFWRLIEPVLTRLQPRRICEVGVEKGIFTRRLLAWGRANGCAYVGIDPAPDPAVVDQIQGPPERTADRLLTAGSLEVLPELERCDVYFLDGDHNYHTVRRELELIQRTAAHCPEPAAAPIIFAHDVSWPFARRDMYHQPAAIPPEACHPYSEDLGVSLEGDELVEGGLRSPGQYAIAVRPGGPCNGVRTAVEDFLASEAGRGWQAILVPIAYGLAILYRPDDRALPAGCRDHLNDLHAAVEVTGKFFESCEANFLQLYLYSEHTKYHLDEQGRGRRLEQGAHYRTLEAYRTLEGVYQAEQEAHRRTLEAYGALEGAYKDASIYNEGLAQEYDRLHAAYAALENEYAALRGHCADLQRSVACRAPHHLSQNARGDDPPPGSGAALARAPAEK